MEVFKNLNSYEKYGVFLRKKEFFIEKLRFFMFSTLKISKLKMPLINSYIRLKWCCLWMYEVLLNGFLLFSALELSFSNIIWLRLFGYGIAMFSVQSILKKLWKNYTIYKFRLSKIVMQDLTESRFKTFRKVELKKRKLKE